MSGGAWPQISTAVAELDSAARAAMLVLDIDHMSPACTHLIALLRKL